MSTDVAKTAFLFPGQGAQAVGMGATLCVEVPEARALFDRASSVLGYDLLKLCTGGPAEKLDTTVYSQPALYVVSLAALERLKRDSPELVKSCAAAAGLSLGEYTALVFAGVMDFEAGLRVVQERGRAMQAAADAEPSGMVSLLGMERDQVASLCDHARGGDTLEIANLLCPGNIVVSGHKAACARVAELATAAGAMKVIPLAVAGAFHTPLMQPAVERLRAALADVPLNRPRIPVVSNVDARPHDDSNEIRELLIKQVCSPVRWEDSMRYLLDEQKITQFYEIGPGRVLNGLLKRVARKVPCENIAA
jgi:[acyl-carrier-protein] S-malonyltransferase